MTQPQTTSSPQASVDSGWQEVEGNCEKHGPCKAIVMPHPMIPGKTIGPNNRCEKCAEERREAEEEARRAADARRKVAKIEELFGRSNIPLRFRDKKLASYRAESAGQKRAASVASRFVEKWPDNYERGTSLILTGGPGTGKTHLACGIGSALIEQYQAAVLFLGTLEALRSIKATYNRDSEITEQEAIDRLLAPHLLILDEVGVQVGSEHEKLLLFDVLNSRYQDCMPTILLSNLSGADLENYLGQRVMDRYRECGAVLAFDWESYRGRQ